MEPILPFWFKQRQCKLEAAGENTFKVTAPNVPEAYLRVFSDNGGFKAGLRTLPDGADTAVTNETLPTAKQAWEAAFELYRINVII